MMKTYGIMVVAVAVCLSCVAYGQVPGADPPAAPAPPPIAAAAPGGPGVPGAGPALPPKVQQYLDSFKKAGIPEQEATLLAVIMAADIDPMKLMMLMGIRGGGGGMDGDAMGMMMFSQAFQGGKGGQAPWFREGEWMYVLDDEVLYKLNVETMKVDGKLAYKEDIAAEAMTMSMLIKAMMAGGGGKPPQPAQNPVRQANLKQLALAMHVLLAETNGQFPGENWVAAIAPKTGDKSVLRCPAWPEAPVGYAMNDKLIDAKLGLIKEPARIVLLFETQVGGESPVGNAADVPMDPIFGQSMVCAAFVDGHVEMVDAAELQRRLQLNPFGE